MARLAAKVKDRVRNFDDDSYFSKDGALTADQLKALREAEKLADQFADVKPERYTVSGNYLFARREIEM